MKRAAPPLFYVGRRPCTWATIMGVVVSVSLYESRSMISGKHTPPPIISRTSNEHSSSVDDGSEVIDCIRMHNHHSYFESRPYPYTPDARGGHKPSESRAEVGWIVSIVGKIVPYRGTMQLHIDRLGKISLRHLQLFDF